MPGSLSEKKILSQFSRKEQKEIKYKQRVLSSLAYFIGKDFEIPVELNQPDAGWHWDFKANKIRIDPKDLLDKPLDYLRYLVCHEGSHRRISRTDFIPLETWQQPGFSSMMNAVEDARVDNFVAENYPKFRQFSKEFHSIEIGRLKERIGSQPRFIQAGLELLRHWFNETQRKTEGVDETLSQEVQEVVQKTLASARDSWWRYPLKAEADSGEEQIKRYAKVSYEINLEEIWPEFKKLIEEDMKDQKMQESLKDMQSKEQREGKGQGVPSELKDNLTPQEQKEFEDAIDKAIEEAKKERAEHEQEKGEQKEGAEAEKTGEEKPQKEAITKSVDLTSLSEDLKRKIQEYIDSLPPEQKEELRQRAEQELRELEKKINEELEGKLSENPKQRTARKKEEPESKKEKLPLKEALPEIDRDQEEQRQRDMKKYRDILEKSLEKDENIYEQYRREVLPIIDELENELREIFVQRRANRWKSGFKTGKKIDIKTRIQEKAKGISAVESKAWQKRELPTEKDYAISILVDLSGSMSGQKIKETFKALIVLSEVLNRLSIKTEILGFNDRLYEYQVFGENLSREIRENMGGVLREVNNRQGGRAAYNDDGWALQETSKRLAKQRASEKFVMVLSDGVPEESPAHSGSEFDLSRIVNRVMRETDQKLIGLGIGSGTQHVERFYPNSLANINVKEMTEKLADTIREMIVNYQNF